MRATGGPVSAQVRISGAWLAALLVAFLLLPERSLGRTDDAPRRILILHSFNYTLPSSSLVANGARQRLLERSPNPIELDVVYLDFARFSGPDQELTMARFLRDRYAGRRLDAVMAISSPALLFVIRHRGDFAPGVPIVFLGVSRTAYEAAQVPRGVTGHVIDDDLILDRTLTLAETLQPDARRLYVIAGSAPIDRRWQTLARNVIERRKRRFETTYLFEQTYDELTANVSRIPRDAIVLLLTVIRDSAGRSFFVPGVVGKALAELSQAPVYSPYYHPMKGPLGGFVETYESMGSTAADIVLDILAGKDPATIPPRPSPDMAYRVDDKAMGRWGLSEKNLPPGTVIMDKDPSLWDLYRWYVIGAISIIAIQALLIAGLVVQRRRRQLAEASIRAKESALRISYDQVRQLNGQLINAQEEERARIARQLHDDVGQRIASVSIGLSGLKRRVTETDVAVRKDVSELQHEVVELARDLRGLSHELHPGVLQHVGLPDALRARCEEIGAESNIKIEVEASGEWPAAADEISICLYRVAQEALRNIAKHSNATTGRVSLVRHDGEVVMRVADDGRGFEANGSNGHSGIGVLSMSERVRMLGGSFEMQSSADAGTIAVVSIPIGAQS